MMQLDLQFSITSWTASEERSSVKPNLLNFEHAIHQADQNGEVLTSEFLNELYADLNETYYGLKKKTTLKFNMNGLVFLISTITIMFINIQQVLLLLQP